MYMCTTLMLQGYNAVLGCLYHMLSFVNQLSLALRHLCMAFTMNLTD